jgi:hypothetical protein
MEGSSQLTAPDSELGLANVLVYDVTDAELLLLLHPHQLNTLMDKNVLLLGQKTKSGLRPRCICVDICKDKIF